MFWYKPTNSRHTCAHWGNTCRAGSKALCHQHRACPRSLPVFKPRVGLSPSARTGSISPLIKTRSCRGKSVQAICGFAVPEAVQLASHHCSCGTEPRHTTKRAYGRPQNSLFSFTCWKLPDVSGTSCVVHIFGFWMWIFSLNVFCCPANWGRKAIINHLNEGGISASAFFHMSWLVGGGGLRDTVRGFALSSDHLPLK